MEAAGVQGTNKNLLASCVLVSSMLLPHAWILPLKVLPHNKPANQPAAERHHDNKHLEPDIAVLTKPPDQYASTRETHTYNRECEEISPVT